MSGHINYNFLCLGLILCSWFFICPCSFMLSFFDDITGSFALWLPGLNSPSREVALVGDQKVGRERSEVFPPHSPCGPEGTSSCEGPNISHIWKGVLTVDFSREENHHVPIFLHASLTNPPYTGCQWPRRNGLSPFPLWEIHLLHHILNFTSSGLE